MFFTCPEYKSYENTVRKEEIARNKQFHLFPVFFTGFENFCHFIKFEIVVLVWEGLKFVVWERVKL